MAGTLGDTCRRLARGSRFAVADFEAVAAALRKHHQWTDERIEGAFLAAERNKIDSPYVVLAALNLWRDWRAVVLASRCVL